MNGVEATLAERGATYGDFSSQSKISQALKNIMTYSPSHQTMPSPQREAMEMILHKISRLLNGDPCHVDSWHDIAGYATLSENILVNREKQGSK